MSEPLENIRNQLDYLDTLVDRIRISSDLLDREELEDIDPAVLADYDRELKACRTDLEHVEYVLDEIQEAIEESSSGQEGSDRHIGVECADCGKIIEHEWQGIGSPLGSMHKECAHQHQQRNPQIW